MQKEKKQKMNVPMIRATVGSPENITFRKIEHNEELFNSRIIRPRAIPLEGENKEKWIHTPLRHSHRTS